MRDEIGRFVASLAIPDDRKAVVLAELTDHAACAAEAATREGRDPEEAARAALGNLEALRRSLEAVEPAFRVSRWHALARGLMAAAVIAIVVDQGGVLMHGVLGCVVTVAIAALCAPPRALDLLRAELRARRIRGRLFRGVPIGPALVYAFTVVSVPPLVWTAIIIVRASLAPFSFETPISAFAVLTTVWALLLVESIRARRPAAE
jgi:hypothetical protein